MTSEKLSAANYGATKYGAMAMYIVFCDCEPRRRSWAKRTRRREITSLQQIQKEAETDDEVILRNARSKVTSLMRKAGLSIDATQVAAVSIDLFELRQC